jgi:hypothetical protein
VNVVYWVGVKSSNENTMDKHSGFDYFEYSKRTWEYWCKKNGVEFYEYDSTEWDTTKHKVTWTRWFDLESKLSHLDWDKVAVVDASYMIRWDSPNFFDMTFDGLSVFKSLENVRWVAGGIDGYKELFPSVNFDLKKYIDCGFQIFTKSHINFLNKLKDFYLANYEKICILESSVSRGTDQPVYNYMLQKLDIDFRFELPNSFNINHMNRFNWLSHNWQLKEDQTPYFIKYGNLWKFSGFDRKQRAPLMKQTWDIVKGMYNE